MLEGGPENYGYLNTSRREVDGIDDREEWHALKVVFFLYHFYVDLCQLRPLWMSLDLPQLNNLIFSALLLPLFI